MNDPNDPAGNPSGENSQYLQMFLDETEEQLEDLVETMLLLEKEPGNVEELNEAFRLIHSIKGSAAMMGFENIAVLTHNLESRFENLRSGLQVLDAPTTNLVLRCVDFLRDCTARLRAGQRLAPAADLLEELESIEPQPQADEGDASPEAEAVSEPADPIPGDAAPPAPQPDPAGGRQITIRFEADLPLADLKARLILARLAGLGKVLSSRPAEEELADQLSELTVCLDTDCEPEQIRTAADVDGVQSIEVEGLETPPEEPAAVLSNASTATPTVAEPPRDESSAAPAPQLSETESAGHSPSAPASPPAAAETRDGAESSAAISPAKALETAPAEGAQRSAKDDRTAHALPRVQVAETMRVDIDRLDNLMNLVGELIVNQARFVQVARRLKPVLKKPPSQAGFRELAGRLKQSFDESKDGAGEPATDLAVRLQELHHLLTIMDEQGQQWEDARHCFGQLTEAIDQLGRVSESLQRGVLDTRMAPVAPLFNRFRRVVRDLSQERGKKVNLAIRGEKTELDKRMIDELQEPLVHLIRNSIDHGMESPEARRQQGKPETGSILLEASHSGNNVYVCVCDDGAGIRLEGIRRRLVERGMLSEQQVEALSDEQTLEYIWSPGFSTAATITDVSGRGVGMDVVKTRITELNGAIEVVSTAGEGTTFSIRLPLTLAIINSLLVRIRGVIFAIPIDSVREIVTLRPSEIVTLRGRQTFDVRDEFMPLACIDQVFQWRAATYGGAPQPEVPAGPGPQDVVILQSAGRSVGLRVDELLGSQDIVIKSLAENLVDIRGLSGASTLGDGTVSLMLDVAQLIGMAASSNSLRTTRHAETGSRV